MVRAKRLELIRALSEELKLQVGYLAEEDAAALGAALGNGQEGGPP
jgi:hypothetical protein